MAWGLVASAGIGLVGSMLSGGGGGSTSNNSATPQVYDPYGPYRNQAAQQLNALMKDPNSIQNLPEYSAAMQAASRASASQGYNGSGNALVAAAMAGGQVYQQAFNNLALLSGAGQSPAQAKAASSQQADYNQQANNQMWGQIGNTVGQLVNNLGNSNSPGGYTTYNPSIQVDPGSPSAQFDYNSIPNINTGLAGVSTWGG